MMVAGGAATESGQKIQRAVVVCNGPLEPFAAELLSQTIRGTNDLLLLGVDGGANRLRALGLLPHIVTGDFDSLTEDDLLAFEQQGATIVPTPDQDYTDFDKALTYLRLERGIPDIRVFGAVGGRVDHTYSVLSALVKHGSDPATDIRLVDAVGETHVVSHELILIGDDLPGRVLSLMALGPVHGITTTGVRWPLTNESLAPGVRDGTLNDIIEPTVIVRVENDGNALLVLVHHRPLPPRHTAR